MISNLSKDDLYSQIVMLRNVDSRAFIIVEGEDDLGALGPHIDAEVALIMLGYGKVSALGAIELADSNSVADVLGIIDRDWGGDVSPLHPSPNVAYTDYYDIGATLIFASTAVDRVVANLTSKVHREGHLRSLGDVKIGELLLRVAAPLGALRRVSVADSLELHLRDFPVHEVIADSAGSVNLERLIRIAASRSKRAKVTAEDISVIRSRVEVQLGETADPAHLCSGHDLVPALAYFMRQFWGAGRLSIKVLSGAIRAAVSCAELATTSLFKEVERWGAARALHIWTCPT